MRFRDKMHRRLGAVAAEGAPNFSETDLFKIPADAGFDPTEPFRLQLLVQRDVAAIERVFTTFEMSYDLPAQYMQEVPGSAPAPAEPSGAQLAADQDEMAAQSALWKRIWLDKTQEIIEAVREKIDNAIDKVFETLKSALGLGGDEDEEDGEAEPAKTPDATDDPKNP